MKPFIIYVPGIICGAVRYNARYDTRSLSLKKLVRRAVKENKKKNSSLARKCSEAARTNEESNASTTLK